MPILPLSLDLYLRDGDDRDIARVTLAVAVDYTAGTPETGRGYLADPANYDPGSGPEYYVRSAVVKGPQPVPITDALAKHWAETWAETAADELADAYAAWADSARDRAMEDRQ